MLKVMGVVALVLVLAGCMSDEERMAQLAQADDASCRATPNVPYETCRNMQVQYRMMAAQQRELQLQRMGYALRGAGAALQAASPPPPRTTNCHWLAGTWTCSTF